MPGRFGELAADALRYWEPRRLIYNAVLLAVVGAHFIAGWPASRVFLARDPLLLFFLLAVLANIAYCAAYGVDLFVQFSGLRQIWDRRRWVLLVVGTAFAAVIAHFVTLGILAGGPPG
ncbi:MAG: hypothetical protein E6K81_09935 [Candidatus Eisenbacteria bacterium]|uniref:Uncharacterized protein n=1 Tax=Eiseniibacteriota bacterium TaxID=2212470 RepID=A0A538U6G2_UNCEI|nr:MAG: hypothetical protein E6K81_09935 [Candidatus Eisenbacteria bacterium]